MRTFAKKNLMSSRKYSAIVVGAGRIGASFDGPTSKEVLTHAHALKKNSKVHFLGFVDANATQGKREAKRWGVQYFRNLRDVGAADIVIVATPDATHANILEEAVGLKPKIIICEKPIIVSTKQISDVRALAKKVPIIVNYSRRFDTTVQKLRRDIENGKFGRLLASHAIYTGGLIHNGSHAVDLFRYLFGDKEISRLHLIHGDAKRYTVFEVDLLMEKGRIRFVEEGRFIEVQRVVGDLLFHGYRALGRVVRTRTKLDRALPALYDHVIRVFEGRDKNMCSVDDAIKTFTKTIEFA